MISRILAEQISIQEYYILLTSWFLLSSAAFLSTLYYVIVNRVQPENYGNVLSVFHHLTTFLRWSAINRGITSGLFTLTSFVAYFTPHHPANLVGSIIYAIGLFTIVILILISNHSDHKRLLIMKKSITSEYAKDVDLGIRDAIFRLGIGHNDIVKSGDEQ